MQYRHQGALNITVKEGTDMDVLKKALDNVRDQMDGKTVVDKIIPVKNKERDYNVRFRIDAILTDCFFDVVDICREEGATVNGSLFYIEISPVDIHVSLYVVDDGKMSVHIDVDPELLVQSLIKVGGWFDEDPF